MSKKRNDLKNHAVDNLSMIPPVEDEKVRPAAHAFDLTGRPLPFLFAVSFAVEAARIFRMKRSDLKR